MLVFSTTELAKTMPSSSAANPIMTTGEVPDYLKVTERTIYRPAGAKQIPAFKVGGSWRFSKADIDRWIREQSSTADLKD
jgi:excisionase family DNA binding protein